MTHSFFTAANIFLAGVENIASNYFTDLLFLSPSDKEISPIWFSSPPLPVKANNVPVFEKITGTPRQNLSSQTICNTPLTLCFVTVS